MRNDFIKSTKRAAHFDLIQSFLLKVLKGIFGETGGTNTPRTQILKVLVGSLPYSR